MNHLSCISYVRTYVYTELVKTAVTHVSAIWGCFREMAASERWLLQRGGCFREGAAGRFLDTA